MGDSRDPATAGTSRTTVLRRGSSGRCDHSITRQFPAPIRVRRCLSVAVKSWLSAAGDAGPQAARRVVYPSHRETVIKKDVPLDTLTADARYACRGGGAPPAVTAIAVLSLALGIGANAAIFSVINEVMMRPLPVSDPGRLVILTRGEV